MTNNLKIFSEKNPFKEEVDEKSFYYFPALKQRFELLSRLHSGESRLVLVLGDKGSGKTLLLKQLLADDEDKWKRCRIHPDDLPEASSYASNAKGYPAFISTDKMPAVILDDAHNMTESELMFFTRITGGEGYEQKLKQVIFFSDPSILKLINRLENSIADRGAIEKIYMPSLSHRETNEYLSRRICSTGYTGSMPLSMPEINRIFQKSGGLPGRINQYAARMFEKKIQGKKKISSFLKIMLKQ